MAVDTRQKRFSAMNVKMGMTLKVLFEADGAVDADDRAHLLNLYSGIALAGVGRRIFDPLGREEYEIQRGGDRYYRIF